MINIQNTAKAFYAIEPYRARIPVRAFTDISYIGYTVNAEITRKSRVPVFGELLARDFQKTRYFNSHSRSYFYD